MSIIAKEYITTKRLDPYSIQLTLTRRGNHGDRQIFLLFSLRGLFSKEGHSLTLEYNYLV